MAAGQADFNVGNVADEAIADDFGGLVEIGQGTLPGAGLPDDIVLLDGADDGLLLANGAGEGFLSVNVFLAGGGLGGDDGVPLIRYGDHDGVDVVAREQLAVVVVGARSPCCRTCC